MLTEGVQAPDGHPLRVCELRNENGMTISLMDWGATWLSARLPLAGESPRELLLGCKNLNDYWQQTAYLGATVGRYANRIAKGQIQHQGQQWLLALNQGQHQLHGGPQGFNARRWRVVSHNEQQVNYQLISAAGDQGFPGQLMVNLTYQLTADNQVVIDYQAQVDQPCPVNLTNHAYFNLDGEGTDARQQRLQLFSDWFLPVDQEGLPNGPLSCVSLGGMDFRQGKSLQRDFLQDSIQQQVGGYDHAFLLNRDAKRPAAYLWSADGRVQMSLYTSAPALQLYSGNFLADTPNRQGGQYTNYSGIALESGWLPDSPNHPEWPQPDCWLQPEQQYRVTTRYQFLAR